MGQINKNGHVVMRDQANAPGESRSVQVSSNLPIDRISNCQLSINNRQGLIFSSSVIQVSGTAKFPVDNTTSYSILILDENSVEVARIVLSPEKSETLFESPFTWDLKSSSNSYVKSGRYTISLAELSNGEENQCCSVECLVADTREILLTTDLLKSSERFQ